MRTPIEDKKPSLKDTFIDPNLTLRDAKPAVMPIMPLPLPMNQSVRLKPEQDGRSYSASCHRGANLAVGSIQIDTQSTLWIKGSAVGQATMSLRAGIEPDAAVIDCVRGMTPLIETSKLPAGEYFILLSGDTGVDLIAQSASQAEPMILASSCTGPTPVIKTNADMVLKSHFTAQKTAPDDAATRCAPKFFRTAVGCLTFEVSGSLTLEKVSDDTEVYLGLTQNAQHNDKIHCAPLLNAQLTKEIAPGHYTISVEASSQEQADDIVLTMTFRRKGPSARAATPLEGPRN